MTSAVSKAVLLNVNAFLADNNIRRSVGSFSFNYSSPSTNVVNNYITLNPSEVFTWSSPGSSTAATLIVVSNPIKVDVTFNNGDAYSVVVNKMHFVDGDVAQVVFENTGLVVSSLTLLQS